MPKLAASLLTRDFWTTADELVKADGALLDGYERVHTAKQEQERRSRGTRYGATSFGTARSLLSRRRHCTTLRGDLHIRRH